jgi:hypothetical protein
VRLAVSPQELRELFQENTAMSEPTFRIPRVCRFWRYAVGPEAHLELFAIPYRSRAKAEAMFERTSQEVPQDRPALLRRRLFGRVDVVKPGTRRTGRYVKIPRPHELT